MSLCVVAVVWENDDETFNIHVDLQRHLDHYILNLRCDFLESANLE